MSEQSDMGSGGHANRIVVLTGAAGGIGRAVASCLARSGVKVIGIDMKDADVCVDLGTAEGRREATRHVLASSPIIDAVISCAGISLPDDGARTVSVNYFGATHLLEGLRCGLERSKAPRAVMICSIATLFPPDEEIVRACLADDEVAARKASSADGQSAYASGKNALARWVRRTSMRPDWGGVGILVNGVSPGTIKTAMAQDILSDPQAKAELMKAVPLVLEDYAQPEEIAPLIAFLASADNRFMVGQVMFADGGSDVLLRGDNVI
ncbi:MAG: SDR family oxidoreductase [Novosphingobium sp.]|nr:SDR family oxidoreductase [Novosphingobium sp.]